MQSQTARKGYNKNISPLWGRVYATTDRGTLAPSGRIIRYCLLTFLRSACLCFLFFTMTGTCRADSHDDQAVPPPAQSTWNISADNIHYDQNLNQYTATGDVTIEREGRTLTADHIQFNQRTREALAQGNVRLESEQDLLTGERLQFNMDNETGTLTNGTLFFSKNHIYLSGRKIEKTGLNTYRGEKLRLTSCDGPDPDWEITGRQFKVTVEGYAQAVNTALWAGKVPVLYSPYLIFPVKTQRQSGLLMPEMGISKRKGVQYLQPIYWAINDHSDATFYVHHMAERGLRNGLEYRYVLDESSFGTLMAEGFEDRRIDDGQGDASTRWGYPDDGELRVNEDRYWVRMKHDHGFDSGVNVKLDIDVVSDQDYLQEFELGYNGYNDTQDYFQETFGRDIDDYNDSVRTNRLNVNRTWHHYSFNTDLRWYDDVVKRRTDASDNTVQQLPVVTFDGLRQPMGDTLFYYDLTSSYAHLYRINGTRGHRADLYPRVYYPAMLWQSLSIEPSVGLRQTAWQVDEYETEPDHGRDTLYRALYDVKLDTSTELFRIYHIDTAGSDRLKHAITPEIVYEFTPDEDQSDYPDFSTPDLSAIDQSDEDQSDFPQFTTIDRIEPRNLITYGFTNTFTSRAPTVLEKGESSYSYNPFLRFKLSQSFDITKNRKDDPEPFSAIKAEMDLIPGRYVAFDADAQWSPYDGAFESFNGLLSLWNLRGDSLTVDYRNTREKASETDSQDAIESIGVEGTAVLSAQWRVRAGYEYNFVNNKRLESTVGVSYLSQCWGMDIDYQSEQGNERYYLVFSLMGLGRLGNRVY